MLSQYSWGQFFIFVLVLLIAYYGYVGMVYWRKELGSLLSGKKAARPQQVGPANASGPAPLVRTTSVFAAAPVVDEAAESEPTAGAAANLAEPSEPVVSGSLPSSTATATGNDAGQESSAPMETAASLVDAASTEQQQDETRVNELDEVDDNLVALLNNPAYQMPADSDSDNEDSASAVATENETSAIEKTNSFKNSIESNEVSSDFSTAVYSTDENDFSDPLATLDFMFASPMDIVPASPESLPEAESLANFLKQVQSGQKPKVPAELVGTTLVEQFAEMTRQHNQELVDLFRSDI
jgi:hypothetical protein